jgi:hypothetical protein
MDKFKETLSKIEDLYGLPTDNPMALTATALLCSGLYVREADDDKCALGKASCGPFVVIQSKDLDSIFRKYNKDDQLSTNFDARNHEIAMANVREKAKLLDLMGEFYSQHVSPFDVRLVADDFGFGGNLLQCQASDVMALPENDSKCDEWIERARAEMQAFTDFLIARLR